MRRELCLKIYDQAIKAWVNKKDFHYKNIIEDEGLEISSFKNFLIQELCKPSDQDEGDFIEASLSIIPSLGKPENWIQILCEVLIKKNHHSHEEIISNIQISKNPYCIPFLKSAVKLKPHLTYLEYDDYGSYYKKCLWALFAIGTEECKIIIREYSNSLIPELKEEAIYRLTKFNF
jgi:hypothetical protein